MTTNDLEAIKEICGTVGEISFFVFLYFLFKTPNKQ